VKKLLFAMAMLGGVGCVHLQPIGPLAKVTGTPKGGPGAGPLARDVPPDPVTVPAPRPAPPAMLITPGEVTANTAADAAQKLMNELEIDRKPLPGAPRTAEVSVYKGGVKVK
jgi:hypothetical protein